MNDERYFSAMKNTGEVEAELTEYMAKVFREDLDFDLEMLRGTIEPLGEGRTRYTFTIADEEKGKRLVRFIMAMPEHMRRVRCPN